MIGDGLGTEDRVAVEAGKGFMGAALLQGRLDVEVYGPDGELKDVRRTRNTVTAAGLTHIADQLSSSPGEAAMSHMAVGKGTGGTTGLNDEVDRNALTSRTDAAGVVTYVGDWAAGDATAALTEAGVFNAASNGTMLVYATFAAINKGASDTLKITWTLTISTS